MIGSRVRVYRNLHKKCFSVKDMKTGRVIAHVKDILLEEVTFPVSKAGRERVLREKRKNVHAFVQGIVVLTGSGHSKKICYNPYKKGFFHYCSNGREISSARFAKISLSGIFIK